MTAEPMLRSRIEMVEDEARAKLPREVFDYAAGGAGDESTVRRNVRRLDSFTLTPRMMRDVSDVDTRVDVVGGPLAAPLLVAPMGMQRLYHEAAECGMASAAAGLGLGFGLSVFGSCSPQEVADAAGPQVRWRQMYITRDRGLDDALLRSAEAARFDAILCTVDLPVMATRLRDLGNTFQRFDNDVAERSAPALVDDPYFKEVLELRRRDRPALTPQQLIDDVFPHPGCTWDDLAELVTRSRLPVIAKGILHPADAVRAVAAGAAAVVVSNHGGSQHDRSVTSIDALPAVVEAVDGAVPVYFDSGIRRGNHVAAAIARGARAVLVGRPALWGLAVDGPDGARATLQDLIDELRSTMAMAGVSTIDELREVGTFENR